MMCFNNHLLPSYLSACKRRHCQTIVSHEFYSERAREQEGKGEVRFIECSVICIYSSELAANHSGSAARVGVKSSGISLPAAVAHSFPSLLSLEDKWHHKHSRVRGPFVLPSALLFF